MADWLHMEPANMPPEPQCKRDTLALNSSGNGNWAHCSQNEDLASVGRKSFASQTVLKNSCWRRSFDSHFRTISIRNSETHDVTMRFASFTTSTAQSPMHFATRLAITPKSLMPLNTSQRARSFGVMIVNSSSEASTQVATMLSLQALKVRPSPWVTSITLKKPSTTLTADGTVELRTVANGDCSC